MPEEFLDLSGLPNWRTFDQSARQLRRLRLVVLVLAVLALGGWLTVAALLMS